MPSLCIMNIVSYICQKESQMGELLKQARESLIIKSNIKDPKSLMKGLNTAYFVLRDMRARSCGKTGWV